MIDTQGDTQEWVYWNLSCGWKAARVPVRGRSLGRGVSCMPRSFFVTRGGAHRATTHKERVTKCYRTTLAVWCDVL